MFVAGATDLAAQPSLQRIDDLGLDAVERSDLGRGRFDCREVRRGIGRLWPGAPLPRRIDVSARVAGARAATAADRACWATIQLSLSRAAGHRRQPFAFAGRAAESAVAGDGLSDQLGETRS